MIFFVLQLAIVTGIMDMPKQCDIVTSVLCKFTVRLVVSFIYVSKE